MPTLYEWAGGEEAFGRLINVGGITALLAAALALGACGGGDGDDGSSGRVPAARCTPAPGTSSTLRIEPKWSVGDARQITISKTREASGEDAQESSSSAALSVLEAGPKGSRLRWKSDELDLTDEQVSADASARLKEVAEGFEVIYTTDRDGSYIAKRNVPQIRGQLTKMLDLLEEDSDDALAVTRTRPVILSTNFIQASIVKEIPLLHSAYGLELTEGKPESIASQTPNPFGGRALRAKGTVELVEARNQAGCAIVELDVRPNRDDLAESIADAFGAKEAPAEAKRAGLSLHNTARYTYDPGSGWFVRVDTTQSVKIGTQGRSDVTVLTTRA